MNQNPHYRTTLPHQIHHAQCSPIQSFPARFPVPGPLEGLNPMIPTPVTSSESQYHSHIQPFLNNRPNEQLLKTVEQQKNSDRNFNMQTTNDRTNQDSYKPTNTENQFNAHCNQGAKNCIQCFNKTQSKPQAQATARSNGKIMVDVATMTDLDETDQLSWQNVSMPPNTKVAEYLTSLRQFLKVIIMYCLFFNCSMYYYENCFIWKIYLYFHLYLQKEYCLLDDISLIHLSSNKFIYFLD